MTCCQYIETLPPVEKRDLHKNYHDNHYGFPLHDDYELFRKTFKFTGGEIVNEFLSSMGYLPALHDKECQAYKKIIKQNPMWMRGREE